MYVDMNANPTEALARRTQPLERREHLAPSLQEQLDLGGSSAMAISMATCAVPRPAPTLAEPAARF